MSVITADSAKMSRAATSFAKALQQQADQAGRTQAEFLALRAAELGLGDAASQYIEIIQRAGATTSAVADTSTASFAAIASAADAAGSKQLSVNAQLVKSILDVNRAYDQQRQALVDQQKSGSISPAQLKTGLSGLSSTRNDAVLQLKQQASIEQAAEAAAAAQAVSAQRFLASLQQQADAVGKTKAELLGIQAAAHGVGDQAAPLLAKIAAAERDVAAGGELSVVQLQALEHSVRASFDAIAAGASPIRVLATEAGRLTGTFGAGTNGLSTLLGVLTPVRLAMGLTAGAAAALGYAFVEGSKQSKAFADSIVLTGNYAGITEGQFNALAKSISASGQVNVASARGFAQALISTGEIGPQGFDKAAEAAARFGAATGKSATDVATQFASLTRDVLAGATQMNQSLNFLSAAQLQHIKTLQEQGKQTDALGIVYDALNARLAGLEPNLGTLDRVIRGVTDTWHSFWDAAFDIGRTQTIEKKIAAARAAASAARDVGTERVSQTQLDPERRAQLAQAAGQGTTQADNDDETTRLLLRSQSAQQAAAAAQAATAALDKRAENADSFVEGYERRSKSAAGLARDIAAATRAFADQDAKAAQDPAYVASSAATRASILKKIRDDYTDKPAATEGDAQRKAKLDQDLKYLKENLAQEQDALKFNNDVLSQVYAAGGISLQQYYDGKAAITAAGIQKEQNQLTDEQARLEVELGQGNFKDPHERIQLQTQLNESIAKSANLQRDADHAAALSLLERAAATKALTDRITEAQAALLQSEGQDAAAAALRAQTAIDNAKLFATTAGAGLPSDYLDRLTAATKQQVTFTEAQRVSGEVAANSARQQALITAAVDQYGIGLLASEAQVRTARQAEIDQLIATRDQLITLAATNPSYAQAAADAASRVVAAYSAVDPALQRLRTAANSAGSSIASSIGDAVISFTSFHDLVGTIQKDLLTLGTKVLVEQPLEAEVQGALKNLTEGDNPIATMIRGALNIPASTAGAAAAAQSVAAAAQNAAMATTTSALARLTLAADNAAASLGGSIGGDGLDLSGFSAADVDAALDSTGGPTASAGGGGFLSSVGSFLANFFHSGGVVGGNSDMRPVPASIFAGAMRYHSGGIAGLAPDEMAAVLKKGEEVVTRSDPRHRDNGGTSGGSSTARAPINMTINFQHAGAIDKRSQSQIGAAAFQGAMRAYQRFGG